MPGSCSRRGAMGMRVSSASRRRWARTAMLSCVVMVDPVSVWAPRSGQAAVRAHQGEAGDPFGDRAVIVERCVVWRAGGQRSERGDPGTDLVCRLAALAGDPLVRVAIHCSQIAARQGLQKGAV